MSRFGLATAGLVVLLGVGLFFLVDSLSADEPEATDTTTTTAVETTSTGVPLASTTSAPTTSSVHGSVTTSVASTTTTTSTSTSSSTTAPPSTTTTVPPFSSSIATPTADQLHASWEPGCPVAPADLRLLTISHWNYAGSVGAGQIVVAAGLADQVIDIFRDLYNAGFPIERMEPVDKYDGDDDQSMAANNTSAFNCRPVTGGSAYSEHSYGRAIDINPLVNPYVSGSTVLPPAGGAYVDRSLDAPGMIHANDEVVQAFAARGWIWGGTWSSIKDYQHFSTTGR